MMFEHEFKLKITKYDNCKDSKYCYQPAGHLVTGDLKIITDSRIRSIICVTT